MEREIEIINKIIPNFHEANKPSEKQIKPDIAIIIMVKKISLDCPFICLTPFSRFESPRMPRARS